MTVKYATQLLAILLIVSLSSVMIISTILYASQIDSQKEQLSTVLKSISQIGADNISKWIDERKTNVKNLAEARVFTTTVRDLTNPESTSQEIFQSKLEIQSLATYVDNSWVWVDGLKISDPNTGEKIFGYKNSPTKNLIDQQHFIDAVNGNVAISEIYSSEELVINEFGEYEKNVPTLLISAPIYSESGLEGILTARIDVFKIDSGVIKYVSDFNSGDAYMVDSKGFLLSRSAFPQDIVDFVDRRPELELQVFDPINQELTKLFQSADKSQSITIIEGYNDYRGIPVIGSINSISGTEWFFIFEIDEAEAYQEFRILGIIVGYSLAMLSLVVFVTSSYFAQVFSKPIIYLKESAEQITGGNLDTPIKTKGAYEVLKLSESMEDMRKSVKKSIETERELIEAKRKRIEEVLYDTIPNPVITFDKNDKFVNCNKIFLEKLGYSKDETIRMSATDFIFEEDQKIFRDVIKNSLIKGIPLDDIDLHIKKQDGTVFHALWSHMRLVDGENEYNGFTSMGLDLTETDKLSDELSKKEKLEIEKELATAQQRIEMEKKLAKEKEDFVAMITHDLKQPLVPISGNAEMLNNPKMGELNEMQRDCVDEITANASRQLSMIDNLVSAQKLGAGAMEYDIEELSTMDILKECIKTHTPAMTDKNIDYFSFTTLDVKVKGDNRRIQESFTNLILNAHDFVPQNGKIEVGVTDGDKEVTFFVKDDGEGIPKDKQDQLFKKYGQVKSDAKRKFGGTGLGLAVAQELVEGMKGKIWLESDEGKGTTFFFTIPKTDGEQK